MAQEFSCTVRVKTTGYPILRKEKNWDAFDRSLQAVCCVHGLLNVLSKTYFPVIGIPEFDLYDRHLGLMHQIFVTDLQTDKGKEQVRKYQINYSAQRIYVELAKHCAESSIAGQTAANQMTQN